MSEAPDPTPAPPSRTPLEAIFAGIKELAPAVALAAAVPLLVLHAMPDSNEKVMLTVIGALAGFLTGRATAPKGPGQ